MKRFIPLFFSALLAAPASAQFIGTGNNFNDATDEIGIARNGTAEGYATPASVLAWVQANVTFPDDLFLASAAMNGDTLELTMSDASVIPVDLSQFDDTAAIAAVQAALTAHIAADLDTDPTNELYDDTALQADADAAQAAADAAQADIDAHIAADLDTDPTNELYDDTAVNAAVAAAQTSADDAQADIDAHVLADADTDVTNELGGLVIAADGTVSYDADGNADLAATDMATQAELDAIATAEDDVDLTADNAADTLTWVGEDSGSFTPAGIATNAGDIADNATDIAANTAAIAADTDGDPANELGGLTIAADGTLSYDADGNADAAAVDMATQAELDAAADTDVSAVSGAYIAATNQITVTVTEDGTNVTSAPIQLPTETTASITAIAGLTDANRGLDLPEANKPRNRAATLAEVDQANATDVGLNLFSLEALITNRAAEEAAGASGMMNSDGSLGFGYRVLGPTGWSTTTNGAMTTNINVDTTPNFVVPAPDYAGQHVVLNFGGGLAAQNSANLTVAGGGTFSGVFRKTDQSIRSGNDLTLQARSGEAVTLVAFNASVWRVVDHNYGQFSGVDWHENLDGTLTVSGNLPINPAAFPAFTTFPTDCADNGTTYICTGGLF